MNSSTTAPIKATKITPPNPPNGELVPSARKSQPPTNAPMMPRKMSPMRPEPLPPITSDAKTPETKQNMSHVKMGMLLPLAVFFATNRVESHPRTHVPHPTS